MIREQLRGTSYKTHFIIVSVYMNRERNGNRIWAQEYAGSRPNTDARKCFVNSRPEVAVIYKIRLFPVVLLWSGDTPKYHR